MNWLIENWFIVIADIAMLVMIISMIVKLHELPKVKQIENVKQFLIYACVEAERALGANTGQLKLRFVYNMFVDKFPWLVRVTSFDQFSDYVDEALETVRGMLENNTAVKAIVESGNK